MSSGALVDRDACIHPELANFDASITAHRLDVAVNERFDVIVVILSMSADMDWMRPGQPKSSDTAS